MSSITSKWDEDMIRNILSNLDRKTGLKGATIPIHIARHAGAIGCFENKDGLQFWFRPDFIDDPSVNEAAVVDLFRHEYAHYYVYAARLDKYIGHARNETSHGKDWKWACKMVGAVPKAGYYSSDFQYINWTATEAAAAYNADDIPAFDVLGFIDRWGQVPVDDQKAAEMLSRVKAQYPHAYYETGDRAFHPICGYGTVVDAIAYNYWTQKICVRFDRDHSEKVYRNNAISKIIDGKIVPFSKNTNTQISIEELLASMDEQ